MSATDLINSGRVVIFSWVSCPFCRRAKALLQPMVPPEQYKVYELDQMPYGDAIHDEIIKQFDHDTVPAVFINGKFIGGFSETDALNKSGELQKLLTA